MTVRDCIEDFLDEMPSELRGKVGRFVDGPDARYLDVTYDDGGAELAQYWLPLAEGREARWWWNRRPKELPLGW